MTRQFFIQGKAYGADEARAAPGPEFVFSGSKELLKRRYRQLLVFKNFKKIYDAHQLERL